MNNIRCIIVDDEPLALNKLKRHILKFPFFELIASCHSADAARRALESNETDLIFVDINMPDVNGLDFIKSLTKPPMVVFVTAYSEYAVESYKVNAVDYLLKPYSSEDFNRVADKVYKLWTLLQNQLTNVEQADEKELYLKCDYRFVRVECDEITHIEGHPTELSAQFLTVPFSERLYL